MEIKHGPGRIMIDRAHYDELRTEVERLRAKYGSDYEHVTRDLADQIMALRGEVERLHTDNARLLLESHDILSKLNAENSMMRGEVERLKAEILIAYCIYAAGSGKICEPCCCEAKKILREQGKG
jgi:uncharacterized small protein (DUF1192 family)